MRTRARVRAGRTRAAPTANATTATMGDNDNRSAKIQVPKVTRNCTMMDDKVPATLRATRMLSTPVATPSSAPPGTASPKRGSNAFHSWPGDTAALTAKPNASSATASFSKLSPCRTANVRRGRLNSRSTAAAAAASGGATMAPSATAAANGNPASAQPAQATAAVVSNTSTTASEVSGNQMRSISRGGRSKAVSMTAGATNKANARRGSMLNCGAKGNAATQPPASASMAG